jgi:hypothetical protein
MLQLSKFKTLNIWMFLKKTAETHQISVEFEKEANNYGEIKIHLWRRRNKIG